jgi:hypothetical protein
MKKLLIFILSFIFIFASSASATVYKWVDERGVVNFTDDYSNVPPSYRDSVVETNAPNPIPSQSVVKTTVNAQSAGMPQVPPIAQTLIPEGYLAIKLAEALKIGAPMSEAEAESMLTSIGIQPRNGWIADYPVTPDIIGELQNAIGAAADTGKFAMKKDEAIKALQDLASQQGLPVRAGEGQYAQTEAPPDYGDYSNPAVINNYYYDQGPPIVTYYPPPPDYSYLYAWVPYPFWCSGFWFRGFFILHDFHKSIFVNRGLRKITNHMIDPKTKRVAAIDPRTRGIRNESARDVSRGRGFSPQDAERGAGSIFMRSQERAMVRNSAPSRSGGTPGQVSPNRSSNLVAPRGRSGSVGPPVSSHWMQSQPRTGFSNMSSSLSNHQSGFGNRGGITFPRPSFPSAGGSSVGGVHGGGFGNRSPLVGGLRGH